MSKNRSWCFTLNNYTEEETECLKEWITKYCVYGIFGKELAPTTGTPHLQGYFQRKSPGTKCALIKVSPRATFTVAKGSAKQNEVYCTKEDKNAWVFGEYKQQGERNDLEGLKDSILAGEIKADDVALSSPAMYHAYGRTLNKIEDLAMRRKFRKEMTKGIWLWGPTGVGKSHEAFKDFSPDTHYVYPYDGEWMDGYAQQDTMIINDFRGEIKYGQMLQLVDKWPHSVRRRNREPMPFLSKTIIVTASKPPELVYSGVADKDDSIAQLLRRFEVIFVGGDNNGLDGTDGTEVLEGNINSSSSSTFDGVYDCL